MPERFRLGSRVSLRSPAMTTEKNDRLHPQRGSAFTSPSNFFKRRERSAGLPQRGVS
jgi:hypothetical protein